MCRTGVNDTAVNRRSRSHNTDNIPLHTAFCCFGILNLFANGNLVSLADHPGKIQIQCMIGNTCKRNRVAVRILGPRGLDNIQLACTDLGVLPECFVKVTHPHKENTVRILFLEHSDLFHCRSELLLGNHR